MWESSDQQQGKDKRERNKEGGKKG